MIQHDPLHRFVFAPLTGITATPWRQQLPPHIDSLVLIENTTTSPRISIEGIATARIARHLAFPWSWLGAIALALPNSWLNGGYRFIAKNRHHLSDTCPPMPPQWKDRFLK
jgi:predicted DCC family thiol-disulfide oxidoreductase YuxK